LDIKEYKKGDEIGILDLFESVFNKKMSLEYWEWRFIKNPIHKNPMITLMWDDDKIVGHYAISPNKMQINDKTYLAALSMTTMTHPKYSGRGIFTKLATSLYKKEFERSELSLVWGFPNNNSHRGFIKNLKWKNACVIPTLTLDVPSFKYIESNKIDSFREVKSISLDNVKVHDKCVQNYDIKLNKDLNYFNWRYTENPESQYIILEMQDSAFVVAKLYETNSTHEIDILEWSIPIDFNFTKEALNAILQCFAEKFTITKINLWLPLNDKRHLDFEKLGFTNSAPLTYLGYSILNNNIGTKLSSDSWYFQMGDSDVY